MKKTVLFSVLALTASAFADGEMIAAAQQKNSQAQQNQNNMMMNMVTLTSARPESDNGWYLFGDVLYWHADVGSADWGWKDNIQTAGTGFQGSMHHLDFKWSWGFKAGIGVNMDHDMWDSNLYYTWFRTENSNEIGTTASQTANTFLPPENHITKAALEWKIHFSMIDWELGRAYYVSKNLALRPHVGVKGGWINQERQQSSTAVSGATTEVTSSKFENEFWGVGPSVGVNTMWVLGSAGSVMDHRFSLIGDFAGALMYGHFHNTYHTSFADTIAGVTTPGALRLNNLDRNLAVPMLQAMLGLSWDTGFNRARNHFTMKVGYEFQYWFKQNQYIRSDTFAATSQFSRYSDDLALQGLTAELRFDF